MWHQQTWHGFRNIPPDTRLDTRWRQHVPELCCIPGIVPSAKEANFSALDLHRGYRLPNGLNMKEHLAVASKPSAQVTTSVNQRVSCASGR